MPYTVIQGFGLDPTTVFKPENVQAYLAQADLDLSSQVSDHDYFKYTWQAACNFWTDPTELVHPYLNNVYEDADFQCFYQTADVLQGPNCLIFMPNPSIGDNEARFLAYDLAITKLAKLLDDLAANYYNVDGHYVHLPLSQQIEDYLAWYAKTYHYHYVDQTVITKYFDFSYQ